MISATEERLAWKSDRQAMERDLEDVHRRLDEYEGELRERLGRGLHAAMICPAAPRMVPATFGADR